MKTLLIGFTLILSFSSFAYMEQEHYQDPCIATGTGDCVLTTGGGGGSGGYYPPLNPGPIVNPTPPITTSPPPITGGGGIATDWSAECKAAHVADFGNYTTVTCPAGYEKSNMTCGCQVVGIQGCFTCDLNAGVCPSSAGVCKLPRGCGSLVCAKSSLQAVTLNQSRVVTLGSFSAGGGLNYGGISVCDIFDGASDLAIHDSLKDPLCKRLYRSLGSADRNQVPIPRRNELQILDRTFVRSELIRRFTVSGDRNVFVQEVQASP